jgi:hypothetical protein
MYNFAANNTYFVVGFFAGLILLRFVGRWLNFTSAALQVEAAHSVTPGSPSRSARVIVVATLTNPLPWLLVLGLWLLPLIAGLVPVTTRWYWCALGLIFAVGISMLGMLLQRRRRLAAERAREPR